MTTTPPSAIRALVEKLQASRGRRAVLLHSALTADTVPVLYECLRRVGRTDGLDLVLSTSGGAIATARRVAMLLREFTEHLTVLVPYRARSAGTLLCLSADELVLGPLAELGPVDSTMDSGGAGVPDAPDTISSQDIRAFRSMAEDWFDVNREEDRLQVLALLATRIFPASLSSFYRFDKLVREAAADLLEWQLAGDEHRHERDRIVERLVSGYHSHDAVLTRRDVRALGLRACDATDEEEEILWALSQAVRRTQRYLEPQPQEEVAGVIAASDFIGRDIIRRARPGEAGEPPGASGGPPNVNMRWEISD